MNDDILICTHCDAVVATALGYDGYVARCGCSRFMLSPGSRERPHSWERFEDVDSPEGFIVERKGLFYGGNDAAEEDAVVCKHCSTDEHVTVSVEHVNLGEYDRKATVTCDGGHGITNRANSSSAYYRKESSRFKILEEHADD